MRVILPFLVSVMVLSVADAQQYTPMYPPAPAQGQSFRYPDRSPQSFSPYDQNYAGPMNMYGQPTFSLPHYGPIPGSQQQREQEGIIPIALEGLSHVGRSLWGLLPAPVRGEKSPYELAPGSGQVIVNFVPGVP